MKNFKAWLYVIIFSCFVSNIADSLPSLLSQVKSHNRQQFRSAAESLSSNWASRSNPYLSSYVQQQQQQQQYIMAQPPPVISPFSLNAQKQVDTRFKAKALKLVSPQVRKYMQDVAPSSLIDPNSKENSRLLRLKKKEQQISRTPFSALRGNSNQRYRNRGIELKEELLEEIHQNQSLAAAAAFSQQQQQQQQSNGNTNKTGLNIHRYRPGGIRRRQFKLATDDSTENATAITTTPLTQLSTLSNDVSQIDLIKSTTSIASTTKISSLATNLTTTSSTNNNNNNNTIRFKPGARRRYGYKNFKQVQPNSTDNTTQIKFNNDFRIIVGSRNGSLFNETFRRPFGGRLFEKQLFRSYIQKKKLIQLLENETISENELSTTTISSLDNNNNNNELDSDSSTALSIINDYNKNSVSEYNQETLTSTQNTIMFSNSDNDLESEYRLSYNE